MYYSRSLYSLIAFLVVISMFPFCARAGDGANFVLYTHHTPEAGERELMLMNDIAQNPDGKRYAAQMVELELGITDRLATAFMVEGQKTGANAYRFTGFRWENRYRLFDYGTFLNPVIYLEYEDLSADTLYVMEMSGREDATPRVKARPRERVFESRLILGGELVDGLDLSFNWLNESDLDTGVTAFGYALGLNYRFDPRVMFGLELFGGTGDSDKGFTLDPSVTQHYLAPNIMLDVGNDISVKFGGAIGLTNVSQDIVRLALGYEF